MFLVFPDLGQRCSHLWDLQHPGRIRTAPFRFSAGDKGRIPKELHPMRNESVPGARPLLSLLPDLSVLRGLKLCVPRVAAEATADPSAIHAC
jgi:hypothetical protein